VALRFIDVASNYLDRVKIVETFEFEHDNDVEEIKV
jgi:hypothetical protein